MSSPVASAVAKRYWRAADAAVVLVALAASGQGVGSFCRQWQLDRQRVRSLRTRAAAVSRIRPFWFDPPDSHLGTGFIRLTVVSAPVLSARQGEALL